MPSIPSTETEHLGSGGVGNPAQLGCGTMGDLFSAEESLGTLDGCGSETETGSCGPPRPTAATMGMGGGGGSETAYSGYHPAGSNGLAGMGCSHCSYTPSIGNQVFGFGVPTGGPLSPQLLLTYNARSTESNAFGYGWSDRHARWIEEVDLSTVEIHRGDGRVLTYTNRNMQGYYTPPAGATGTLQQQMGTGWVETRPNGFEITYNTDGDMTKMEDVAGNRWTFAYTGTPPRVETITDPGGGLTTYSYDGSDKIDKITDAAGRETQFDVDGNDDLVKHVTPELCTTSLSYDASHRLTTLVDPEGHRHTYSYDDSSRLASYQNPLGQVTTYTYSTGSTITAITDALGNTNTLTFDDDYNLTAATNPLGQTWTQTWSDGYIESSQNPLGHITTFVHHSTSYAGKRLGAVVQPLGERTTYNYDASDRLESTVDPLGNRTTQVWNASSQRIAVVNPLGHRTSFSFNSQNRIETTTNPLGAVTTNVYDSQGNQTVVVNPLGERTSYTYDDAGQQIGREDALGNRTTLTLDDMNRVTAIENPLGYRTSHTYDLNGRMLSTENALGYRTTSVFDAAGRPEAMVNPLGQRMTSSYDAAGNQVSLANALGYASTTVYDAANQPIAEVNPLGCRSTTTYDVAGRKVAVTDATSFTSTTVYDADDRATANINPLGYRSTTVYDKAGRATAQVNPLGERVSFTLDAAGRQVDTMDPLGNRTTSVYDAADQVLAQIDPLGNRATSIYDAVGRGVASIDALGNRQTTVYDVAGRAVAGVHPLGYRHTTVYDAAGQSVATMNPLGSYSTSVYDTVGQVVAQVDPLGNRSTLLYDAVGRRTATTNALNETSTVMYDAVGRTWASIDPLGNRSTFAYDAAGQQTSQTNALGYVNTTVYDSAGKTIASIDPLGNRQTVAYDAAGRTVEAINPLGYRSTTVYDAAGRTSAHVDALGYRTSLSYDVAGRQTETTNPLGLVSTQVFDAAGRTLASINPLGHRVSFAYDAAGRQVAQTKPKGNTATTVYDSAGRTVATIDGLGHRTTLAYDVGDNLLALMDTENQITTYEYDVAARKIKETYPDHVSGTSAGDEHYGIVEFSYDGAGRLKRKTDQLGDTCTHEYDLGSRLSHRDYRTRTNSPSGTISDIDTFTYDSVGQMLSAESGRYTNKVEFAYDATGRRKTEALTTDGQTYTTTQTYDATGQLTGQTYPDGSAVDRTYTPRGQLEEVKYNSDVIVTRTYDAGGRLVENAYGNNALTTYTYQNDNLTRSIEIRDGSNGLIDMFTLTYDANQNKTQEARSGAMANWGFSTGASGYDANDRLVNWNRSDAACDQSWTLTYEGDWRYFTDEATTQDRTHGPTHELTAIDSTTLTYDAKGNLTKNVSGDEYTWDFDNKMRMATVSGAVSTYSYDALGRRTSKEVGAANTVFVARRQPLELSPFAGQVVAEYTSGAGPASPTEKYVYGPYIDGPIIKVGTAGTVYFHANDLFSVAALTDTDGATVERYAYTAYGVLTILAADGSTVRSSSDYANPFMSTGRRWGRELEMYYYRTRYYDPTLGRFTSRDFVTFDAGRSWNSFAYTRNHPTGYTDPTGLAPACTHLDSIFFIHGGPRRDDIEFPRATYSEGTVCATITVIPGTCPNDHILMSIRYSAHDPIRHDCDEMAKDELLYDLEEWIYEPALNSIDCTLVSDSVIPDGYKRCPEVTWRIKCFVGCVSEEKTTKKMCENKSGRVLIIPRFKTKTGPAEALVVEWTVKFTDECCLTSPCESSISLAQTGTSGYAARPRILIDDFTIIHEPTDPPCPEQP